MITGLLFRKAAHHLPSQDATETAKHLTFRNLAQTQTHPGNATASSPRALSPRSLLVKLDPATRCPHQHDHVQGCLMVSPIVDTPISYRKLTCPVAIGIMVMRLKSLLQVSPSLQCIPTAGHSTRSPQATGQFAKPRFDGQPQSLLFRKPETTIRWVFLPRIRDGFDGGQSRQSHLVAGPHGHGG